MKQGFSNENNGTWRKVAVIAAGIVAALLALVGVATMMRAMPLPDVQALSDHYWSSMAGQKYGFGGMVAEQMLFVWYLLMRVWVLWLVPLGVALPVIVLLNRPATHAELSLYLERVHMLEQTLKDTKTRADSFAIGWDVMNHRLDELFESAPELWMVADHAKGIRRWNRHAMEMARHANAKLDTLEGKTVADVLPGYSKTPLPNAMHLCFTEQKPWYGEVNDPRLGMWFLVWVFPLGTEVALVLHDISHEHRDEGSLKSSEKLLRRVVEESERPLAILGTDWTYKYVSRAWPEVMGLASVTLAGRDHRALMPAFPPNMKAVQQQLENGHGVGRDEERLTVGGREVIVSWRIRPWSDVRGQPGGYIFSAQDQTELVRLRQQVNQAEERENALAYSDALTGLPNRQLFNDRLNMALAQAYRQLGKVALLFLDLDGFKGVNDQLGHDYGDILLKQVAQRLKQCVRTTDTVARLGGDEFTIILAIRDKADAEHVAGKILAAIRAPYDLNGKVADTVGTSIGIAMYPQDGSQAADLMRKADNAMYAAKQAGKNAYRFATEEMQAFPARDGR